MCECIELKNFTKANRTRSLIVHYISFCTQVRFLCFYNLKGLLDYYYFVMMTEKSSMNRNKLGASKAFVDAIDREIFGRKDSGSSPYFDNVPFVLFPVDIVHFEIAIKTQSNLVFCYIFLFGTFILNLEQIYNLFYRFWSELQLISESRFFGYVPNQMQNRTDTIGGPYSTWVYCNWFFLSKRIVSFLSQK